MEDLKFNCPSCNQSLEAEPDLFGLRLECPNCGEGLKVPKPESKSKKLIGNAAEKIVGVVDKGITSAAGRLTGESQDPNLVIEIQTKISQILTRDEELLYVAIQNKPIMNVKPDAAVLTNRRFIIYKPKILGRVSFEDHIWRNLKDVSFKEGILGATVSFTVVGGPKIEIDHIPKSQARKLYAIGQEMEERVFEERRRREIEEKRAAAGGVVIHGQPSTVGAEVSSDSSDPVARLKQLKEMMDAGLISPGEFEAKRQEILSSM